jgi:hypothetical protein
VLPSLLRYVASTRIIILFRFWLGGQFVQGGGIVRAPFDMFHQLKIGFVVGKKMTVTWDWSIHSFVDPNKKKSCRAPS